MNGILVIDKPHGLSSAACVARVRKRFNGAKTGHAGTLDPDATGVLVMFVGKSTRLSDILMSGTKEYEGEIQFGITSTTDDLAGELTPSQIPDTESYITSEILRKLEKTFTGELLQTPPQVSAIKIDGKRAYDRARRGETFEIKSRPVTVYSLHLELREKNKIFYRASVQKVPMCAP
jgi:tRNA pseudouridine55 synthase